MEKHFKEIFFINKENLHLSYKPGDFFWSADFAKITFNKKK